jgi:hypothetical protein
MENCGSVLSPEDPSVKLHTVPIATPDSTIVFPYLQVAGSLLYLYITTRPDIGHAIRVLCSYLQSYGEAHIKYAKHVLRYVRGTSKYGLMYKYNDTDGCVSSTGIAHTQFVQPPPKLGSVKITPITTSALSDSNYLGLPESLEGNPGKDYKSITGSLIYINGNLISWLSKKQALVSQSTCEAELYAAVTTTNGLLWVNEFLSGLHFPQVSPSLLYCDNQAVISLSQSFYMGNKVGHIAGKWHVLYDYQQKKKIKVIYIKTTSNSADIMTKSLKSEAFIPLRNTIVSMLC